MDSAETDHVFSTAANGHEAGINMAAFSSAFVKEETNGLETELLKGKDNSMTFGGQKESDGAKMESTEMHAENAENISTSGEIGFGQEEKRTREEGDCASGRMVKPKLMEGEFQGLGGEEELEASPKREKAPASGSRLSKRRKIAMLIAYCGYGYQGMQKNPGAITIEGLLEEALFRAGAISESHYGDPRKVDWMRAARTDKGVSAVGQIVSGLFHIEPPGFVERVNSFLPAQIRVLGYNRVVPSFNAKKYCDRRRYEYVIPVFAFDPSAHRDRESVLASEGKDGALMKCLECSERGRKVEGAVGKGWIAAIRLPNGVEGVASVSRETRQEMASDNANALGCFDLEAVSSSSICSKAQTTAKDVSSINKSVAQILHEVGSLIDGEQFEVEDRQVNVSVSLLGRSEENNKPKTIDASGEEKEGVSSFHFGEAERNRFNGILNHYVGTHNFHNFTTRIKPEDPSARRYIISFQANEPFTVSDMQFVRCTVVGQSFILHQIRKMIGLAIAIFRDCAPESMLNTALQRDVRVNVPTAPELGLFLDECMYPAYNQKWGSMHGEISQSGYEDVISDFKHGYIYSHIAASESKDGAMALFLHSLNDRNFPDFATAKNAEKLAENQTATCIKDLVP